MTNFPYKKVLLVGATSGIGLALAERMIKEGLEVVVSGRREERLKDFVEKNGGAYETCDMANLDKIPAFIEKICRDHPDLDAVILNSGVQRAFNFSKPETVSLDIIDEEITVNYTACVHFTQIILPFLLQKQRAAVVYVSSGLGLVPSARCLNYCATKAALHAFSSGLRYHLKDTSVRVLEIIPPAVQTELRDNQAGIIDVNYERGQGLGVPLDKFTNDTWNALQEGREFDEYPIDPATNFFNAIEKPRKAIMAKLPQGPADI